MVGKRKQKTKPLGNHQKCWLWGRHAVLESLRGGRWLPIEIHIDEEIVSNEIFAELRDHAARYRIELISTTSARISQLSGAKDHQGLMGKMREYPYVPVNSVLQSEQAMCLLVLDRIQDPFNFGSILRSAVQFGVSAVIIGTKSQAAVSTHVARSSAGAVNHIDICQVDSLKHTLQELRQRGLRVMAASEKGTTSLDKTNLSDALAIVIGNEGEGVAAELLDQCDQLLTIPQSNRIDSLNAAVAAGVICYEVQRQRGFPCVGVVGTLRVP